MSRFRIDHRTIESTHAEAGHDAALSFYVDIVKGERVVKSYDHFHPAFNRKHPLLGCLDFLVSEGFFTSDELNDALVYLQDGWPEPPREVKRVVRVIEAFKSS